MEYVDVEGLVQPILTIKVNTREAGSVDRIVGEEGNMMNQRSSVTSKFCFIFTRSPSRTARRWSGRAATD